MKKTISQGDFVRAFDEYNRADNFTVEGRRALFDYLEEYEEGTGEEIELDVIAICCDFSEYESALEAAAEYGEEPDAEQTEEEQEEAAHKYLEDNTAVIDVLGGGVIIQQF